MNHTLPNFTLDLYQCQTITYTPPNIDFYVVGFGLILVLFFYVLYELLELKQDFYNKKRLERIIYGTLIGVVLLMIGISFLGYL